VSEEYITPETCALLRKLFDAQLAATNARVDGILEEIQCVRDLQKQILYTLIIIGFGVGFTLFGVLVGRGLDLGWLIP
jgi:hypothetical protein